MSGSTVTVTTTSRGMSIVAGETVEVLAGGTLLAVSDLGYLNISAGGLVSGGSAGGGAAVTVFNGGVASAALISGSDAVLTVSSGGSTSDLVVSAGGVVTLLSQGVANATTLLAGGTEQILSGGQGLADVVNGGSLHVLTGGTALGPTVEGGGIATAGGTGAVLSGAVVKQSGAVTVSAGGAARFATIDQGGTMTLLAGGTASFATLNGAGTLAVAAGASLTGYVDFTTGAGRLDLAGTVMPTAPLSGFTTGDLLDLTGVAYAGGNSATIAGGHTLVVSANGAQYDLILDPASNYSGDSFTLSSDNAPFAGGTEIAIAPPCYLAGTAIATAQGERPIETLAIGDLVRTAAGALRPIRWIGTRFYRGAFAAANPDAQPIRIAAGALADGVPARDLFVSADHALLLDGALIPAGSLVNGRSIARARGIDPICYFHLELDSHDVILAEGAAAESFVDCDSRGRFHNAAEFTARYPTDTRPGWAFCAPRYEGGALVAAVAARLAARAGLQAEGPAEPGPLLGHLDEAGPTRIAGWGFDPAHPDVPVVLDVMDGLARIGRVTARAFRADLVAAGHGGGRAGFAFHPPLPLDPAVPHEISLHRASDGAPLPGGPILLPPRADFAAGRAALARVAATGAALAASGAEIDAILDDLAQAAETLRARRARLPGDGRPRLLVIDDRVPDPARDAGSVALLSHMAALQALGFAVEFVAAAELDPIPSAALEAAGIARHGLPAIASVEEVLRRHQGGFAAIYIHRLANAEAYLATARRLHPGARLIYALADLHGLRLARQAAVQGLPQLARAAAEVRRREQAAMRLADAVVTHSPAEAAILARAGIAATVVPWQQEVTTPRLPFAARSGVAMIANYTHAPNLDAADQLLNEVMPRVWAAAPALRCYLVGHGAPAGLVGADPRVALLGPVAALSEVFDLVRLTVAPLRFGAGIKGKVLASLAAGVPCVVTGCAAEGLALPAALAGTRGEDAAALAAAILRLHDDPAANAAAAAAGQGFARDWGTAEAVRAGLRAALGPAIAAVADGRYNQPVAGVA
ncbi:MAG: Hint domain-containing protein [Acetobacteraceae bacterium]